MSYCKILSPFFLFVSALFISSHHSAQVSTYNLEFIRALQTTTSNANHILAIFKVTPTVPDFKLVLSMRVIYGIGQGEKTVNIQKQKEDNIRISIYGSDVAEKHKRIYELIKDKVNMSAEKDIRLLVFDFYNITKEKIDTMTITYGLWESNNTDIRNEKKFDFKVETDL